MKKEYKDFYRFLWKYLEGGKSAIIIKPRQVGMTTFAARYAAWCLDYKDTGVQLHMCNRQMLGHMNELIAGGRANHPYQKSTDLVNRWNKIVPCDTDEIFHIFDEIDFNDRLEQQLCGTSVNQFLAYSSIGNYKNFNNFYKEIIFHFVNNGKKFEVFNMSDTSENGYKFGI